MKICTFVHRMKAVQNILAQWREDLLLPNQNDVLVQLVPNKNALPIPTEFWEAEQAHELASSALLKKLVKQSQDSQRESGVATIGIAQHCISFEFQQKSYHSPLFLAECKATFNRIKDVYEIVPIGDPYFNPFLNKLLGTTFESINLELILQELNDIGLTYSLDESYYLANFHPHRFVLLREVEALSIATTPGKHLESLLLGNQNENEFMPLHEGLLFDADFDQRTAIKAVEKNDIVVQGPPGTGKSQVIANLLGKVVGDGKQALLIAEKQVALTVIYDLFRKRQLHHFCLLHHHQLRSKDFVASLKSTWEFLEKLPQKNSTYLAHAELLTSNLQLNFDRLNSPALIGGYSYAEFKRKHQPVSSLKSTRFLISLPDLTTWEKDKRLLQDTELANTADKSWCYIKLPSREEDLSLFAVQLRKTITSLQTVKGEDWTRRQLEEKMLHSSIANYFFYDDQLLDPQLFLSGTKAQKQFLKLYNHFIDLQESIDQLSDEKKNWKTTLNLSQLLDYTTALNSTNRFNLKTRKKRKELLRLSNLDFQATQQGLDRLIQLKKLEEEQLKIKQQLRKLHFPTEEVSLKGIFLLIQRTNNLSASVVKKISQLPSSDLIELRDVANSLDQIFSFVKYQLILRDDDVIYPLLKEIEQALAFITCHFVSIQSIDHTTKEVLRESASLGEAERLIYANHWQRFQGKYPELAQLSGGDLYNKLEKIISQQRDEQLLFASHIQQKIKITFDYYHQLLQTPANKLNSKEKAMKKSLRQGKSILVKAFAKQRNIPTALELLSSEARLWISLLKPIVLGSPYSIAKSFPLETDVFDLVVFDEASQIPLPHAVGGIHRGKRIVIAGDQQQMAPSFYFQSSATQAVDLLHQANYYWKKVGLTHHYRSQHPQLITFSNRYFYENELQPFPAYSAEYPFELITTNGIYHERQNETEAQLIAELITKKVQAKCFDFGLVAFSQAQLNLILQLLDPLILDELNKEEHQLLIQSLENVQGEQCDHLFISLGYGKNKEGKFNLQFGPLNKENGYRRLNVLMSRARKKITFVRSVTANDFSISDNEGVDLLRKLMLLLEKKTEDKLTFPFGLNPRVTTKNLTIENPQELLTDAQKWITIHEVLSSRGWKINYSI